MVALGEVVEGRCKKMSGTKRHLSKFLKREEVADEPTDGGSGAGNPQTEGVSSVLCSPGASAPPSALCLTSSDDGGVGNHSPGCFPVKISLLGV